MKPLITSRTSRSYAEVEGLNSAEIHVACLLIYYLQDASYTTYYSFFVLQGELLIRRSTRANGLG